MLAWRSAPVAIPMITILDPADPLINEAVNGFISSFLIRVPQCLDDLIYPLVCVDDALGKGVTLDPVHLGQPCQNEQGQHQDYGSRFHQTSCILSKSKGMPVVMYW